MIPAQFNTGERCSLCGLVFVFGFITEITPGANTQWLCSEWGAQKGESK